MTPIVFVDGAAWPFVLLLLPALALGAYWSLAAARHRRDVLGPRGDALVGRPVGGGVRAGCAVAATALGGLALLQPAWGVAPGAPAGADVVLCLDLSRSMAARDAAPSRLGAAQRQIERLAAHALGARLGLVAFAGEARLLAPLTGDLAAITTLALASAPGGAGGGGTDLGAAIDLALAALQRAGATAGSIVVLSDGEDFAGRGAAAAARARAAGAVVHCVGLGSAAGSKVVVEVPGGEVFLRDATGADVVTRLDGAALAAVAAAGGGRFAAGSPDDALVRLHDVALAPRALGAALRTGRAVPMHRYQWCLCAALLAWMLRACLPERRR